MKIREYEPSDLESCRSLWTELTQHHRDIYNDQSIDGDNPGLKFDEHLDQVGSERIWVALVEDEIAGFTSLIHKGQEAEVEPIVVSSNHRGKGIGQVLLNHAIEEAKKSEILCLSAKPVARNEGAISFFYNSGFRTLGHIQLFIWLGPAVPGAWKPGPQFFGKSFDY